MDNLWSDKDAKAAIKRYAKDGINEDLALRTYTTQLLGGEPRLVLHGGGNTSVKTVVQDILGEDVEVLCVKGSGWDMGVIEPPGLPAVRLAPLQDLTKLDALTDEQMVNVQRCNLMDSASPNPSVETLLHAFLPHKFIDHTHANAVLSLVDQPNAEEICDELYGDRMAHVPYIMPGFDLAKKAYEVYQANPDVEGLILIRHGIFTFGDDAKVAYDRMIEMVSMAEDYIASKPAKTFKAAALPKKIAPLSEVAPILRGLCALPHGKARRWVLDYRTSDDIRAFVDGKDLGRYSQIGTATPDHVIRTKPWPVILPTPEAGKIDAFIDGAKKALKEYTHSYRDYFDHQNETLGPKKPLDRVPRVLLVPGLGLFGLGKSASEARVAADLAETNVSVITDAERIGQFTAISDEEYFEFEHWSLEQAKLGKGKERPLARFVAVVTGGGSGIGAATARSFKSAGAEVAVLDMHAKMAEDVAKEIGGLAIGCDVTNSEDVRAAFDKVCEVYGGVDVVVSNAGAAWQGAIGEVDEKLLRASFELNFWAHQTVAQNAVRVMKTQGTGGCLLFNCSKQAVNPGPLFGPYGLPKAATLFLMRQYAIDYGDEGIRSNAVNADRIRSGLLSEDMIAKRSKARGLTEKDYMSGNLLNREVTAENVAEAFVALAQAKVTTAAVVTVDGGNIAAALR